MHGYIRCMIIAPIHQAKTKLTQLLQKVEQGERVVITRHGEPVAELVRAREQPCFSLARVAELQAAQGLPLTRARAPSDFDEIDAFDGPWADGSVFPGRR
ncbi:MAG: type II toxin-antitoxin system prevent-host-death family antitoxin [Caulobacterales bacterium]|nr:type II toxin-antitoxin system prevent-host-death family antitoxin [Caulobacterales bacterium]